MNDALAELSATPPRDFVKARAALAARLRQEGQSPAADAVLRVKRPPVAVWAVNRLAREAGGAVGELIESSERVRAAQLGRGQSAGTLATVAARQRAVLADLMHRAKRLLDESGVRASAELSRRIEATLVTGALDKESRSALREGRLDRELPPLGFDVFGGATPAHPRAPTVTRPRSAPAPPSAPPAVTAAAERQAKRAAARAERAQAARRRRDEARAQVEKLRDALGAASSGVRQAREELGRAREAVGAALRVERAARRALAAARRNQRPKVG